MRLAIIALMLGAGAFPVRADERPTLAMLGLHAGAGMSPETLGTIGELLLTALDSTGRFTVTGRSDLVAVLGLERERQLLGCDANTECMAEIAGALGVEYVASGDVGRLGSLTILTLKLIEVRSAKVIVRVKRTVSDDGELAKVMESAAAELAAAVRRKPARASELDGRGQTLDIKSAGLGAGFWSALVSAGIVVSVGGFFAREAFVSAGRVRSAVDPNEYVQAKVDASRSSTIANVAFTVAGATAIGAGVVWLLNDGGTAGATATRTMLVPSIDGLVVIVYF